MGHYLGGVLETADLYNTAGFNDDIQAFPSIKACHPVWRRASADWLAGLCSPGLIDDENAYMMIANMAYHLVKKPYKYEQLTALKPPHMCHPDPLSGTHRPIRGRQFPAGFCGLDHRGFE